MDSAIHFRSSVYCLCMVLLVRYVVPLEALSDTTNEVFSISIFILVVVTCIYAIEALVIKLIERRFG